MPGQDASRWIAQWAIQIIEAVLVLVVFIRALFDKREPRAPFESFCRLARRKALCVVLIGVSVFAVRAALIPLLGVAAPAWHDEFSYLLAADTFAHGRVTNPTHPMWKHFETFHIVQQPTYMSMYPPAQGLALAIGEKLGNPWIGQLLVTAALCSVLCWMLQGWFPPAWALLGAILAALRIGILSYWMNGYWSASIVALGGALVVGAYPRLRQRATIRDGILCAAGLLILANSRPYEGLLVSAPFVIAMAVQMLKQSRQQVWRTALSIIVVLALGFAATGSYYYRVTGSPFRMTYEVNRSQYAMAPYFIWQKLRPAPEYRHAVMRTFYEQEVAQYAGYQSLTGFWHRTAEKFWAAWTFYLGPLLTLPLLWLPWLLRDRRIRLPIITLAVLATGVLVSTFFRPHYLAPATGLLYIILVQGMRHMTQCTWRRNAVGANLAPAVPAVAAVMICLRLLLIAMHTPIEPRWPRGNLERAQLEKQLETLPRKQLVLVSYGPSHNPDNEWVSNMANIDAQKVVWARDMGPDNSELLDYYPERQVWQINPDEDPVALHPH